MPTLEELYFQELQLQEKYYFGLTYGIMIVFSLGSFVINSFSIRFYGKSKLNVMLFIGDIAALATCLPANIVSGYMFDPIIKSLNALFFAIQIAIVVAYPAQRSANILNKNMYRAAILSPILLFIIVFLRGAEWDTLIDRKIPFFIFLGIAPISYCIACYCLYVIGKLIRSNPGSIYDVKQQNLEKISNAMVVVGGSIQILCIILSLFPMIWVLNKALMTLTGLLFAFSDLIVTLNRFIETKCVIMINNGGLSQLDNHIDTIK